MADVLGAAAGCGMAALVGMLIGVFLCETGCMQRKNLMGMGKAAGTSGLFALLTYGLLFVMHWLVYGNGAMHFFSDVVHHPVFNGVFYSSSSLSVSTHMMINILLTVLANVILYRALQRKTGEENAQKSMAYLCMLPGMECCFLPMNISWVWLCICVFLFVMAKWLPVERIRLPKMLLYMLLPVMVLVRCFLLYRLMVGV